MEVELETTSVTRDSPYPFFMVVIGVLVQIFFPIFSIFLGIGGSHIWHMIVILQVELVALLVSILLGKWTQAPWIQDLVSPVSLDYGSSKSTAPMSFYFWPISLVGLMIGLGMGVISPYLFIEASGQGMWHVGHLSFDVSSLIFLGVSMVVGVFFFRAGIYLCLFDCVVKSEERTLAFEQVYDWQDSSAIPESFVHAKEQERVGAKNEWGSFIVWMIVLGCIIAYFR